MNAPHPESVIPGGPPGRRVVPAQPTPWQHLVAWAVFWVESAVTATLRTRWKDCAGLLPARAGDPVIFCLWHNRLALCMLIHRKRSHKLAAMISPSKDGALLAAVLQKFGVQPVRGSSSRRGSLALLEMATCAQSGYDLAITPDGPRGPRGVVQGGVIALAQLTGLPIVPVTWHSSRRITINSWDRFQIPVPFARCDIILEEPIQVPRHASEAERELLRARLEYCLHTRRVWNTSKANLTAMAEPLALGPYEHPET